MTSRLNPYLNFNGNARQALEFYHSVFGGNLTLSTFAEFGAPNSPDADRIMHGQLETDAGYTIMAADVTSEMEYQPPVGCSISLSGDDDALHLPPGVATRDRATSGRHYTIPLPAEQGTGLGKPLKLINKPVRERIPILVAALGPKNVELAAEIAEGWQPIFYLPEKAQDVWGKALASGQAKRDPALGDLDVYAGPALAIGENVEPMREFVKPHLALYIGGMGAKGKNFYHTLATRYGYGAAADRIQELYLSGDKDSAVKAVPDELVRDISLIGTRGFVKERLAAFREAGVTALNVVPIAATPADRIKLIETLRELVD